MTDEELITVAWGAGLFEGEGTIGIQGARVNAAIQMTDLDVLETMQASFGGNIYDCGKQAEHHKQSWKWSLTSSKDSIEFLNKIYAFVGSRRKARIEEARVAYENHRSNKRARTVASVKELRAEGLTHQAIADRLDIDRTYVSHILRGKFDDMVAMV